MKRGEILLKLGSLFSGSGGFELAGVLQGIVPVWSSEIEPYPIAVTSSRFPSIKHLGDIKNIDGSKIEPVDIITFGSPCQNLSIAGNQKGLEGEQSSLFYEAIRIIKEMRSATDGLYPRIAVWENVPGAFSSNKGEDFRTVLQEFVNICEPSAVVPKVPKAGWSYYDCWHGDRWSIAYRTFDAQFWGVPQRRRRIYLVADFRGKCAKEILFEQDGLRGYFEKGRTPWEKFATYAKRSVGTNDCVGIDPYNGDITGDKSATLGVNCGISTGRNGILIPITFEPGILKREGGHTYEGIAGTIRANAGDNQLAVACGIDCYNQCITGDVAKSITAAACDSDHIPSVICMATQQGGAEIRQDDKAPTLTAAAGMSGNNQPVICFHILQNPISSDTISPCVSCGNSANGQAALGVAYVMVENHPADSRVNIDDSGTCQCLTGRMGTGGGNVPLVLSVDMGGGKSACVIHENLSPTLTCTHYGEPAVAYLANGEQNEQCFCVGNGQVDQAYLQDKAGALNCMHDQQCILKAVALDRATFNAGKTQKGFEVSETVNAPLVATGPSAVAYKVIKYIVRRITPTECARLQGFPDRWGIPVTKDDFTDEEYNFWLRVRTVYANINGAKVNNWTKQSMLSWYNKLHTDSAEYKMWGNGVALPTTLYVMQGIKEVYQKESRDCY